MIPVSIVRLDITEDGMRDMALAFIPEEALEASEDVMVLTAITEENEPAGAIALSPDNEGGIRIEWLEVAEWCRHNGIGTILIDRVTESLYDEDDPTDIYAWFDGTEAGAAFEDFLESTGLFDVTVDEIGGNPIRIALWNGQTINLLEEEAEKA